MRIAVGMSGGVDSSVAAAMLKQAGHDVIGVTMLIWPGSKCCSGDAIEDAQWVADRLGIKLYVFDLVPEFTKEVVTPFVNSYTHGRTPNPCPTCNFRMKFHHLWEAVQQNCQVDKMATGHYVRIRYNDDLQRYQVYRGVDKNKDQTYMLYRLSQEQLSKLHFPLGEQTKTETRQLASQLNLEPVAQKKDSQDLCFVGDSIADFWESSHPGSIREGHIIDQEGNILGQHKGIVHYTVGQRKGLGLSAEQPLYVLELDSINNRVIVGPRDDTFSSGMDVSGVNWLSIPPPKNPITAYVKPRYRSELIRAEVIPLPHDRTRVVFEEPVASIAPGQITVFYDENDMMLGGGVIERPTSKLRVLN